MFVTINTWDGSWLDLSWSMSLSIQFFQFPFLFLISVLHQCLQHQTSCPIQSEHNLLPTLDSNMLNTEQQLEQWITYVTPDLGLGSRSACCLGAMAFSILPVIIWNGWNKRIFVHHMFSVQFSQSECVPFLPVQDIQHYSSLVNRAAVLSLDSSSTRGRVSGQSHGLVYTSCWKTGRQVHQHAASFCILAWNHRLALTEIEFVFILFQALDCFFLSVCRGRVVMMCDAETWENPQSRNIQIRSRKQL